MSHELRLFGATATQLKYQVRFACDATEAPELDVLGDEIARLSLTRAEWAAYRAKHRPPPEWYDDE
jgi:hypothetical protein